MLQTRPMRVTVGLILALGACWAWAMAQGQQPRDKDKPATNDKAAGTRDAKSGDKKQAGMEDWMAAAAPGEHHKKLDVLAGTWNLSLKFFEDESAPVAGKAEFKWVMGGRFLAETTGTEFAGQPFEWMGWHGYDHQKKQYVSVWIDNLSTGVETMTGQFDDANKTLTYVGESESPDGGKVRVKWVIHMEHKDRITTEMLEGVGNGKEKKVMEIVATRA